MARLSIGVRTMMVAVVLIALVVAVAIQGYALNEQGRKIAALEAQARKFQSQNIQSGNLMNMGFSQINKSLRDDRKRLDKVEREVAARAGEPARP